MAKRCEEPSLFLFESADFHSQELFKTQRTARKLYES